MRFELCGLDCDVDLVVFVACEDNSSAMPSTKVKHTDHNGGVWLENKTRPLWLLTPSN